MSRSRVAAWWLIAVLASRVIARFGLVRNVRGEDVSVPPLGEVFIG